MHYAFFILHSRFQRVKLQFEPISSCFFDIYSGYNFVDAAY